MNVQTAWRLFGFKRDPFGQIQTPDDYWQASTEDVLRNAIYDACESRSIHAVFSDSGTGKSTALRKIKHELRQNPKTGILTVFPEDSRMLTLSRVRAAILEYAREMGLTTTTNTTSTPERARTLLLKLATVTFPDGFALVIDNAHDVTAATVRGLRQLIEADEGFAQHTCGLVFLGWKRLREKIAGLQDVESRATMHELRDLTPEEVGAYIDHRIRAAGGHSDMISEAAIDAMRFANSGPDQHRHRFNAILSVLRRALEAAVDMGDTVIDVQHLQAVDPDLLSLRTLHERAGQPTHKTVCETIRELGGPEFSISAISRAINNDPIASTAHIHWTTKALQLLAQHPASPATTAAPPVGAQADPPQGDRKGGALENNAA